MILKDACRLQNAYTTHINSLVGYLLKDNVCMRSIETHYKNKVVPTLQDEVEDLTKERVYPEYSFDSLFILLKKLVAEKEVLTKEIYAAKAKSDINIDLNIAINSNAKFLSMNLRSLLSRKESIRKSEKKGLTFNAEQNQVPFYYPVETKTTLDFNKNKVKEFFTLLNNDCDKRSAEVEQLMISIEVNFTPWFEFTDELDDIIEKGAEKDLTISE